PLGYVQTRQRFLRLAAGSGCRLGIGFLWRAAGHHRFRLFLLEGSQVIDQIHQALHGHILLQVSWHQRNRLLFQALDIRGGDRCFNGFRRANGHRLIGLIHQHAGDDRTVG
ncbi:MAG: hypothetical protein ACK56I_06615, partial [bacterium]